MTPRRYAEGTSVSVADSRAAIERLVKAHGATGFASSWDRDRYCIMFELRGRRVRFDVGAPDPKKYREQKKWDAEERRRWRALIKADEWNMVEGGVPSWPYEPLKKKCPGG